MQLPDPIQMGASLRRWRESIGFTAKKVADESRAKAKKPFGQAQVNKWEKGTQTFTYRRLIQDIFPSYRIDDIDVFIDFCRHPGLEDVTVIKAEEFTRSPIADGAIDQYLNRGFLKSHRTRIDKVTFPKGKAPGTSWGSHDGHEFVLVLRGAVTCEFAVEVSGEKLIRTIAAGDAVAFPSALYHKFFNASETEEAELVAARPSRSGTADKK